MVGIGIVTVVFQLFPKFENFIIKRWNELKCISWDQQRKKKSVREKMVGKREKGKESSVFFLSWFPFPFLSLRVYWGRFWLNRAEIIEIYFGVKINRRIFFFFFSVLHSMWDPSSLTMDWTCIPLRKKHRVLTAGLPGKF